ncbi:MAG: M3 family oligoendopeptidase [Candidatus Krumholzibacteriota bacterium]|nr:M3 family oligoendopeptidase [Candidatus Krumholzibacteriota bacterium]
MPPQDFAAFLTKHTDRIEPISREYHLAYWRATVTGLPQEYEKLAELQLKYQKVYANPDDFAQLRDWRDGDAVSDDIERRALDVLYRSYLAHQVDHSLLERMTKLDSEIVQRFNVYRVEIDGTTLTSNEVRSVLRESSDSEYRRAVWEADKRVAREVKGPLLELIRLRNETAQTLGFDNYYLMSLELAEQSQTDLFALFDTLASVTDEPFRELKRNMDDLVARRCGITPEELRPWHYDDPFFQEAPRTHSVDFDRFYVGRDVVALVASFFDGIGLQVGDIIERSDLYEKPGKDQHAYCMDIDRKGDVRVLANVRDDENWAGTMLHELGHGVYDLHISPDLPFVLREHAHVFATEAIAMLLGRLSKDAHWIQSMTRIDNSERDEISAAAREQQRASQLVFARWCQVMVRFERMLYEDPERDLSAAWWELVQRYQLITPSEGRDAPDWAAKIHIVSAPVYYHNYMLGELLASQFDHYIREHVTGGPLTGQREVGTWLREKVFAVGSKFRWDEMIRRAMDEPLNPEYYVSDFVR